MDKIVYHKVEKEEWFVEVGHEAGATRVNTVVTEEGEIWKEHVL